MNIAKKYYGFLIVLILSFFATAPLFIPGFFPIHDDTQVVRVYEMGKSLSDLMFPVRWVLDLGYGYGYPIFNFYAPLAYYVGGLLTLFGFDALVSTKIMMGLGIVLSGVFMYFLAREFFGELGGLVSGLFYLYAPYHAVEIYVRGDVAEFWAYAFISLMFFGFYKVFATSASNDIQNSANSKLKTQNSKLQVKSQNVWLWIGVGALGYTGVILSHNLTALMVTPFLIFLIAIFSYVLYRNKKLYAIRYTLYAFFIALLMSAFYWLPALWEMRYTNVLSQIGGGADFRDHFVCIEQLWDSQWGFGGSTKGCIEDGLSLKIGKFHILLSLVGVLLLIVMNLWKKMSLYSNDTYHYSFNAVLFLSTGFVVPVFFMLEVSKPVWEAVPLMAFFQYPWRFLILASFAASFLSGMVIWFFEPLIKKLPYSNKLLYFSTALLISILLYFNVKLFSPQTIMSKSVDDYTNITSLKWTTSKISDEYMPKSFVKPKNMQEVPSQRLTVKEGVAKITIKNNLTQKIQAKINVSEVSIIHVNVARFKAWRFFVNQRSYDPILSKNGYDIGLPKGQHTLDVIFQETMVERISNTLSLAGLSIVVLGIIRAYVLKRSYEKSL